MQQRGEARSHGTFPESAVSAKRPSVGTSDFDLYLPLNTPPASCDGKWVSVMAEPKMGNDIPGCRSLDQSCTCVATERQRITFQANFFPPMSRSLKASM